MDGFRDGGIVEQRGLDAVFCKGCKGGYKKGNRQEPKAFMCDFNVFFNLEGAKEKVRQIKAEGDGTKREKDKCKDQTEKNLSLTCQHRDRNTENHSPSLLLSCT